MMTSPHAVPSGAMAAGPACRSRAARGSVEVVERRPGHPQRLRRAGEGTARGGEGRARRGDRPAGGGIPGWVIGRAEGVFAGRRGFLSAHGLTSGWEQANERCRRVLRASTLAPCAGKPAADHPRSLPLDYQFDPRSSIPGIKIVFSVPGGGGIGATAAGVSAPGRWGYRRQGGGCISAGGGDGRRLRAGGGEGDSEGGGGGGGPAPGRCSLGLELYSLGMPVRWWRIDYSPP